MRAETYTAGQEECGCVCSIGTLLCQNAFIPCQGILCYINSLIHATENKNFTSNQFKLAKRKGKRGLEALI